MKVFNASFSLPVEIKIIGAGLLEPLQMSRNCVCNSS